MPAPAVTAIIPAYNEGKTVGAVVRAAKAAGFFDRVVVVSDGSTDDTAAAARQAGADQVVELPENQGKGAALSAGVAVSRTPLLCFLDADLLGLQAGHLAELIRPVAAGQWAMSVGMWDRGAFWNVPANWLPLVSGQRVLQRDVFTGVPERFRQGYQVETAMNWYCRCSRLVYGKVFLAGLKVRQKPGKVGLGRALLSYLRMYGQVLAAMVALHLVGRQAFLRSADGGDEQEKRI